MQTAERGHLPSRYRVVMLFLSLLTGVFIGVFAAMQPTAPFVWLVGAALGALLGAGAFVALEHSLE